MNRTMTRSPSSKGAALSRDDRTTAYARAVVSGRVVAGRLVRLACERHLRDRREGRRRGLRWNLRAAQAAIRFCELLVHYKGEWAGQPFRLEPWQAFLVGSLFGWQRRDPESGTWLRRFRIAFDQVARKNGKSFLAAAIACCWPSSITRPAPRSTPRRPRRTRRALSSMRRRRSSRARRTSSSSTPLGPARPAQRAAWLSASSRCSSSFTSLTGA